MCNLNHPLVVWEPIARPELGTRALVRFRELGLTSTEFEALAVRACRWRDRYIEFAERVVELGNEIDGQLVKRSIDIERVKELARERREVIAKAEDEFIDAWVGMSDELTEEHYERLMTAYRREFERLPHPVLGTSAHEAPLGERRDALVS